MTSAAREQKARDWLRTAAKDLKAAQNMLAAGDQFEPYHVCFWAQQAAEKAFKAALIFSARPLDPTHDLNDLADLLPDDWQARRVVGRLRQLTEYAVETRYPDARGVVDTRRRQAGRPTSGSDLQVNQSRSSGTRLPST